MAEAAEFQGTPSAPARRWFKRAAALLTGVPLLAGLVQLPAASDAQAQSAPTGSRTVDVAIKSLTPTTPSGDDTLTVTGTVTNAGRSPVTDAQVELRLGPPMNSRTAIEDAARRKGYAPNLDGRRIDARYSEKVGRLPAGGSRDFTLSIPVERLGLTSPGAYQIAVALGGQTADRPWPQVLGIERTFLPWQPSGAPKKTRLAFLWPLIAPTHVTSRTLSDESQTPVFRDDRLKDELGPGGRLQQMVALGKDLPITWVIDPDLLATADAMTRDYEVEDGEDTRPGKGQAIAEQWLGDLEKAIKGHQVVALPFADPDLASLAHRGKNVPGALSHLQTATELASSTVEGILGIKPRTDFAWPVDGAIDSSIVDVATSAGAHHVIARSDSLQETGGLLYTPNAARQIGGGNTAVVADARLSTAFAGNMSRPESRTLAVQRFLAQSQMLTQQAPSKQRSILVAPQRMPTTAQAKTMAAALRGLSDNRWSQPQNLGQAAAAQPDPLATKRVPSGRAYPSRLRAGELRYAAFDRIRKDQRALDLFTDILTVKDRVETPFGSAILREMSTAWRGKARGGLAFRTSVHRELQGLTEKVRLIRKSTVTLSGRSATIPVTVQNGLLQPVQGLQLQLTSSQGNRLTVGDPQPIHVEGGHSQSVKFGTTAYANGRVRVTAQLVTADGQPYGQAVSFEVNVTEATSAVMLVIGGGVLLLVLAGVRIYLQRKRNAHRDEDNNPGAENGTDSTPVDGNTPRDEGEQAKGDDAPDILVPEQQSDPEPDTGSQSAEPSGSGEKVEH
ncbi:DUF6049 family protein [Streptomyces palmae]|uniref:DUF11 domain-containing protein n=1 Tax=Streptomyces palmae TaxID=1701085 RepID=A0A4Z0HFT6_9ACTN|nr:DUF6049 family protein [Streptomyces palmae]TGB17487.1 DUF11 domain-containing protein [Streptomyces palmae]